MFLGTQKHDISIGMDAGHVSVEYLINAYMPRTNIVQMANKLKYDLSLAVLFIDEPVLHSGEGSLKSTHSPF